MSSFSTLIARILMGERYEAPSERDTRFWMSVLAGLPFVIAISWLAVPWAAEASLLLIWAGLVVLGVVMALGVWGIFLIQHRSIRLGIILIGWGVLMSYLGRQFILLMGW